jgi:hypothetical protein
MPLSSASGSTRRREPSIRAARPSERGVARRPPDALSVFPPTKERWLFRGLRGRRKGPLRWLKRPRGRSTSMRSALALGDAGPYDAPESWPPPGRSLESSQDPRGWPSSPERPPISPGFTWEPARRPPMPRPRMASREMVDQRGRPGRCVVGFERVPGRRSRATQPADPVLPNRYRMAEELPRAAEGPPRSSKGLLRLADTLATNGRGWFRTSDLSRVKRRP